MIITIGSEAIQRSATTSTDQTYIEGNNPATARGKITLLKTYANVPHGGFIVAIFTEVSPDTFTARCRQVIGDLDWGYVETPVDLDVEIGDYIGYYSVIGTMDKENVGVEYWLHDDDQTECVNEPFSQYDERTMSIQGVGEEAAGGGSRAIVVG
ncbi:hypothetical protein ES703_116716 [subsurface metagenome]